MVHRRKTIFKEEKKTDVTDNLNISLRHFGH
jgi:recombination DNA repair RAD52 pathway protein